ncbi:hypothetical protein CYY_000927, partial [Polysphondylium violaceum]
MNKSQGYTTIDNTRAPIIPTTNPFAPINVNYKINQFHFSNLMKADDNIHLNSDYMVNQ